MYQSSANMVSFGILTSYCMQRLLFLLLAAWLTFSLSAQFIDHIGEDESGSFFGIRGGASVGSQNWSGFEMSPLIAYHVDAFLETLPEDGRFSLWTSLGYHIRGSRLQQQNVFGVNGNLFRTPSETFQFRNAVLMVGGKQVFKYTKIADIYYTIGLRLDYTIGTNLSEYNSLEGSQGVAFRNFYPFDSYEFINRINYGLVFGGGIDIPLSDKVGATLQLTAHPDFSLQYDQPPIENVINPFGAGNTNLPQRRIRNFTLELTAGFRFLRKVQYID